MDKYVCTACMWVYDPAENDNIAFEDLPDDYVCPVCGVGKDMFEKEQILCQIAELHFNIFRRI